jgi:hypothetical protein
MQTLSKDVVGLIFDKMTPLDWICTSVTCKSWWTVIRKWMALRKNLFVKKLKDEITLFAIRLPDEKNSLCLRPLYYLKNLSTGCKGEIKDYVCARHKILSLFNREICEICLGNPTSDKCFGNRCDSPKCRDYIYVLRNGSAEKVQAYSCAAYDCKKKTDRQGGLCFSHAVKIICEYEYNEDRDELTEKMTDNDIPRYPCLGMTKANTRCRNKTATRLFKCHQHVSSPLSLL